MQISFYLVLFFLLITNFSWAKSTEELSFPSQQSFQKSLKLNKNQSFTLDVVNQIVSATIANQKQQVLTIESPFENKILIKIDDFNSDGHTDLLVQDGYGYMGVNLFERLFLYSPEQQKFSEQKLNLCNSSFDAQNQRLVSQEKSSGNFLHSRTIYQVANQKIQPHLSCGVLNLQPSSESVSLELVELKNSQNQTIKTVIIDANEQKCEQDFNTLSPYQTRVSSEKTFLHTTPSSANKTTAYLIKGDVVELLNIDVSAKWVLIRFKGKKTLEKWVAIKDLAL